jgi:hypothetical protein
MLSMITPQGSKEFQANHNQERNHTMLIILITIVLGNLGAFILLGERK